MSSADWSNRKNDRNTQVKYTHQSSEVWTRNKAIKDESPLKFRVSHGIFLI